MVREVRPLIHKLYALNTIGFLTLLNSCCSIRDGCIEYVPARKVRRAVCSIPSGDRGSPRSDHHLLSCRGSHTTRVRRFRPPSNFSLLLRLFVCIPFQGDDHEGRKPTCASSHCYCLRLANQTHTTSTTKTHIRSIVHGNSNQI